MNPRTEQDPVTREIVTILKERAAEHGYSFRALEERSGVSKTKIQAIFTGERHLYLSDLEMLCDALGLTAWKVMREAENSISPTATYEEITRAKLAQALQSDYTPAASPHTQPDPHDGAGEENQDKDE